MATNVVKGAGRRRHEANQRHQQRTPLPPKTATQLTPAELARERAEAREEVTGRKTAAELKAAARVKAAARKSEPSMEGLASLLPGGASRPASGRSGQRVAKKAAPAKSAAQAAKVEEKPAEAPQPSRAAEFADYAEAAGWEVKREIQGESKVVTATRDDESLTVEWVGNKAAAPLGHWYFPGSSRQIPNSASAKRLIDRERGNYPEPALRRVKREEGEDGESKPRERKRRVPFDPETATDAEVLEAVKGKRISWTNQYTSEAETYLVPVNGKQTKIVMSHGDDTLGERILSFCDANGEGYRACLVKHIFRVS